MQSERHTAGQSFIFYEFRKEWLLQNSCLLWLDIQSGNVSFLGLLSFGFKGLLRAMLLQSIYVQVPSIRVSKEALPVGVHIGWKLRIPQLGGGGFSSRLQGGGDYTSETIKCLCTMISNEILLRMVWKCAMAAAGIYQPCQQVSDV